LTITPTLYYDDRLRPAIFFSYVLPKHQNIQLDAGWNEEKTGSLGRFEVGISFAFGLKK
jgi:hypothetical protein